MPDEWGRPTFSDYLNTANTISRVRESNQRLADRNKTKKETEDADYNARVLRENEGGEMRGSEKSRLIGMQMRGEQKEAESLLKSQKQNDDYQKSLGALVDWRRSNPGADWEKAPKDLYSGVPGQKAYVDAIGLDAQTEEGKAKRMAAIMNVSKQGYPIFNAQRELARRSLQSGDISSTANILQSMSKKLPLPYQLGKFDASTQTFDVQYLDSKSGKFQDTGKRSLQEVMNMVNNAGEDQYSDMIAMSALAVDDANRNYRKSPMIGKNKNGDTFLVMPQKQWANPNQVDIEVRNEKTNEKTIFSSWEALQDFGINIENLDREKKQKDIELREQQIRTSKANEKAYNRKNQDEKFADWKLYDKSGNPVTAKSRLQFEYYLKKGYTTDNPDTKADEKYELTQGKIDSLLKKYKGGLDDEGNELSPEMALEQKASEPNADKSLIKDWEEYTSLKKKADEFFQKATGGVVGSSPVGVKSGVDLSRFDKSSNPSVQDTQKQVMPQKQDMSIRPELPQNMEDWNFQIIKQNGQSIPVVITEKGPIKLTPEEEKMYIEFSKNQPNLIDKAGSFIKNKMTGTQKIPESGIFNR